MATMAEFQSRIQWRWSIPKELKTPLGSIYLITMISMLLSLSGYFRLQPVIPLFYTLPTPAQQLVAKEWIFLFPGLLLFISALHTTISYKLQKEHTLLLQLFTWTSVGIVLTLVLSQIRILMLVT